MTAFVFTGRRLKHALTVMQLLFTSYLYYSNCEYAGAMVDFCIVLQACIHPPGGGEKKTSEVWSLNARGTAVLGYTNIDTYLCMIDQFLSLKQNLLPVV